MCESPSSSNVIDVSGILFILDDMILRNVSASAFDRRIPEGSPFLSTPMTIVALLNLFSMAVIDFTAASASDMSSNRPVVHPSEKSSMAEKRKAFQRRSLRRQGRRVPARRPEYQSSFCLSFSEPMKSSSSSSSLKTVPDMRSW